MLRFTGKEIFILIAKSMGVMMLVNYYFYRSVWAILPLGMIGFLYFQRERQELVQKKKEQAREQFKELLLLTSTLQKAGYSIENAFAGSYQDMERLFGKDSVICRILKRFAIQRKNHDSFGTLWKMIGEELEIKEICEFAEIYEIAYHHSGNMVSVMEQTSQLMIRKAELQKEIYLSLVERRMEMRIMTVMPFAIIQYIQMTSPEYFTGMYHCLFGVVVMTFACFIYLVAYIWALQIIDSGDQDN